MRETISTSIRFSIIIPVYNVEKYLDECLQSILSQKFGNFEIICIDDCSTDNSWNILEKYAEKDKRIRIFKQEKNAGQGVARNRALDLAQGEYILFVDPDDWIEKDALTILDEELKKTKAQMLCFEYCTYEDLTGKIKAKKIKMFNYSHHRKGPFMWKDLGKELLSHGFAWNCYSKELILKNHIRFASSRYGEDDIFSQNAVLSSDRIFLVRENLYYYRQRKASHINTASEEKLCIFENIDHTKELLVGKGVLKELAKFFSYYKLSVFRATYERVPLLARKRFCEEVKKRVEPKEYKEFLRKISISPLEKIFSITNKNIDATKHKIIRIFGMEFVLSCKKKKLEEKK